MNHLEINSYYRYKVKANVSVPHRTYTFAFLILSTTDRGVLLQSFQCFPDDSFYRSLRLGL